MRQLMVVKARTLAWRDVAEPTPSSATDAVVRPFVGARCDGDAMFLRHDFDGILRAGAMMHLVDEAFRGRSTNPFSPAFACVLGLRCARLVGRGVARSIALASLPGRSLSSCSLISSQFSARSLPRGFSRTST